MTPEEVKKLIESEVSQAVDFIQTKGFLKEVEASMNKSGLSAQGLIIALASLIRTICFDQKEPERALLEISNFLNRPRCDECEAPHEL